MNGNKLSHARVVSIVLSLMLFALLAACGGPAPTSAPGATTAAIVPAPTAATAKLPKAGGSLKIGTNQDAIGFDPHLSNATASFRILENIYSGLLRFNEKLEVLPDLAETYKADSPTQYTFS